MKHFLPHLSFSTRLLIILLTTSVFAGCATLQQPCTKHAELAVGRIVAINTDEYSTQLFEKKINTKGYKTLRVFAHIFNENYESTPIQHNAYFQIIAYYAIGQGSWGYHTETFRYESTSGWSGVANIPIVGVITRVGIHAVKMPNTSLKVDVVASFLN